MDRQQSHADNEMSEAIAWSHADSGEDVRHQPSANDHAQFLIQTLGPESRQSVAAGATAQFAEWLGWPNWLMHGTSLSGETKLPERIVLADDLIMIANIVDHNKGAEILARLTADFRIPGAPITVPALYNAPTLLDALKFFVRTAAFGSPFLNVDFRQEPARFSIFIGSEIPKGQFRDFCASAMLSIAYRFVSFFVVEEVQRIEIDIEAPNKSDLAAPLRKLPGQFSFDADCYALHGQSHWLHIGNGRTDAAFWNFALERMTVAEREGNKSDIVKRIRAAICRAMETEGRVPRLKQIAAAEGVSERTLVRALATQGIRFHQIIEEERRIKASALIGNASISLSEIARMLGFTDMSSFGRSYRQWFGVTPGQARSRRGA